MSDLVIRSQGDYEHFIAQFGCESLEELSNRYHTQTGYEVIDQRDDSEYTNINAQRDPDFWESFL